MSNQYRHRHGGGNDKAVMLVVYSLIGMVDIIPLALELSKRAKRKE